MPYEIKPFECHHEFFLNRFSETLYVLILADLRINLLSIRLKPQKKQDQLLLKMQQLYFVIIMRIYCWT